MKVKNSFLDFQCHDFSVRGMSGIADAAKSGLGHLLSFLGTDNCPAVKLVRDLYHGKDTFVGGSVPASEHSVMSSTIFAEMAVIRKELEENPNLIL